MSRVSSLLFFLMTTDSARGKKSHCPRYPLSLLVMFIDDRKDDEIQFETDLLYREVGL